MLASPLNLIPRSSPSWVRPAGSSCTDTRGVSSVPKSPFRMGVGGFLRLRRARAGLGSARFPHDRKVEEEKKRDMSKRVKSGLLHGLGRFWIWVERLATSPIRPCRRICRWSWRRLLHRQSGRLVAWHDNVWSLSLHSASDPAHCAPVPLSRLVAWSQHDWPGLKDWVGAAGCSPLAAVETASNRCRQCARML